MLSIYQGGGEYSGSLRACDECQAPMLFEDAVVVGRVLALLLFTHIGDSRHMAASKLRRHQSRTGCE